jgi:hypothetical protein
MEMQLLKAKRSLKGVHRRRNSLVMSSGKFYHILPKLALYLNSLMQMKMLLAVAPMECLTCITEKMDRSAHQILTCSRAIS